jgi:hypothetical protein
LPFYVKDNRNDYTTPKSYRPISLLSVIGNIIESVVARRLSYITEHYNTLPSHHFGSRVDRGTEDALHVIHNRILDGFREGKVTTMLLTDISGAFNNVSANALRYDLAKRRIPKPAITWIMSWMADRKLRIKLPGYLSEPRETQNTLPQGSPLSALLYVYYNSELVEASAKIGEGGNTGSGTGYVDDVNKLTQNFTIDQNIKELETFVPMAIEWANSHHSSFEFDKFKLIHFVSPHHKDVGNQTMTAL